MSDLTIEKVEKNPEVKQKPERRRFTLEYKRRIAIEAEGCQQPGDYRPWSIDRLHESSSVLSVSFC